VNREGRPVKFRVSVVIPSLNRAQYIEECIDSARNQTLRDIEIICVDAGSTDGTAQIIERKMADDPRIRLIRSEKKSYGHQVNIGFSAARGEYVAILESDDVIDSDMYRSLVGIADSTRVDFVKADFCRFCEKGGKIVESRDAIARPGMYGQVLDVAIHRQEVFRFVKLYTWSGIYRLSFIRKYGICHNETPGASYQDNGFWMLTTAFANTIYLYKPERPFYKLRRDNPQSSFYSKGKVWCIRDEYDFVDSFLEKYPDVKQTVSIWCWWARIGAYAFTYRRIAPKYRAEFARHFQEILIAAGENIKREHYGAETWNLISAIRTDPSDENPELIRIMRDNRTASLLLRIKWCYQDNGLFYTIRHILLYPFAVFARRKTSTNDNSKDVQVRAPDEALRGVVVESKVQFIGAGSPVPAERSF